MTDEEQKIIFSKNLIRLLQEHNKTQKEVAEAINVSPQTFNTWVKGIALPRMGKVQLLADYFHILKSDLIERKISDDDNIKKSSLSKAVQIKVLGRVAAGIPLEAIEDVIDTEEIPQSLAKTGEFFGLQIHGDSMEPRMCEGDVVIVRQQDDAESGDIVIAMVNGHDATCKRLMKYTGGISLLSFNPLYEPMVFSNEEIETKPVRIIGKVVENRQKY